MERVPINVELENMVILTNETTGHSQLKKVKKVGKYHILFDYTEYLSDSCGNPYKYSIKNATLAEKEQLFYDSAKKAISIMIEEVNKEMSNKIEVNWDAFL